jgi:hypothetical protein
LHQRVEVFQQRESSVQRCTNISVHDGWWKESCFEGVGGWVVNDRLEFSHANDACTLHDELKQVVLPLYQDQTGGKVMKRVICKNTSLFNSHCTMWPYTVEINIS